MPERRDSEIDRGAVTKALAYAIRTTERLPQHLREEADLTRMRTALWTLVPHERSRQYLLDGALAHITGKPQGEVREARERYWRENPQRGVQRAAHLRHQEKRRCPTSKTRSACSISPMSATCCSAST
jgi:hypothetical protein